MKKIYVVEGHHNGKKFRRAYEDKKMAKGQYEVLRNADKIKISTMFLVDRHDIPLIDSDLVTEIATTRVDVDELEKPTSPFPWTTHGHLVAGCDMRGWAGYAPSHRARCGGPGRCGKCSTEALRIKEGQKK